MWKLLHRAFGWGYVQWRNFADQGIARVYVDGDGRAYYWRYKGIALADTITRMDSVLWLTCPSAKYMPPEATP